MASGCFGCFRPVTAKASSTICKSPAVRNVFTTGTRGESSSCFCHTALLAISTPTRVANSRPP